MFSGPHSSHDETETASLLTSASAVIDFSASLTTLSGLVLESIKASSRHKATLEKHHKASLHCIAGSLNLKLS